jgi:DNA-binding NarL/FixJ family response regulator
MVSSISRQPPVILHIFMNLAYPFEKTRVLVAETTSMNGGLLADALHYDRRYRAKIALTAKELADALQREPFDVLLISAQFGQAAEPRLVLIEEVKNAYPEIGVVVLLDTVDRALVVESFRAGAQGVFCRSQSFEELCKCITCVHGGQTWANSEQILFLIDALADQGDFNDMQNLSTLPARALSSREEEIAGLAARGLSNRQISESLELSEHTVKNYMVRVFEKLGVTTRVGLTLHALTAVPGGKQKLRNAPPKFKDAERWYGTDS